MLILELAVQGVRGFSPSVRVALKPGYIALKSPTEVPSPLAGLLSALSYPDARRGVATFLAQEARAGRAGFSIQSHDGRVFRLVRDLTGSGALYLQSKETEQFDVVSQDQSEISQLLRTDVGLPPRTTFEQIFTLTVGQLPTRTPKGARPRFEKEAQPENKPVRKMASILDDYKEVVPDVSPEERLAALEKELVVAKRVAERQFRIDGLQTEIFGVEERQKAHAKLAEKLSAAERELEEAPSPSSLGLPDDIVDRMRRLPEEKKRRDELLRRLEVERDDANLGSLTVPPLTSDRRFLLALALGIGLLVGGAFLEGMWRTIALASTIPFSLGALLALRFVEDLQLAARETSKVELFAGREKKINDDFNAAAQLVHTALDKVLVPTLDEFVAVMAKGEALLPQVEALRAEMAAFQADPQNQDLPGVLARMKQQHEALNTELASDSGGYVREVRDVERDLRKLKEQLAPSGSPDNPTAVMVSQEQWEDPTPLVMLLGADLFGTDIPTLWGVLRDRTLQYLSALTDRRYHAVDLDKDGYATVSAPGRRLGATELPGKDLDLFYLSLRLTLVEKYAGTAKVPVVIEDAFGGVIDAAKQALFQRMLKHLGAMTQVLHVTGVKQNVGAADLAVSL